MTKRKQIVSEEAEVFEEVEVLEEIELEEKEEELVLESVPEVVKEKSFVELFILEELDGTDEMKEFVLGYVLEHFKLDLENTDLGYFDWLFHQHLRDGFIEFAKYAFNNPSLNRFYIERLEVEDSESFNWFEIFRYISVNNNTNNFGKYYREKK